MDAITLLKGDHKTVADLFKRFDKLGDAAHAEKRKIVDEIIRELSIHASIEETAFYPTARAVSEDVEQAVLESLEEHHVVKWLLSELEDMDPSHERFDAKVSVLRESVEHHVEEEEREWFPKLRKTLDRTTLQELGAVLASAKETAPTRPHPRAPDAGPAVQVAGAFSALLDRVRDAVSRRAAKARAKTSGSKGRSTAKRAATRRATTKKARAKRSTAKRSAAKRSAAKRSTKKAARR
jgi:hemerythrin superfamily protein